MNETLYRLYNECFPGHPIAERAFLGLFDRKNSHTIYAHQSDEVVGFSLVQGNSIVLLCVAENCRKRGYGSYLL